MGERYIIAQDDDCHWYLLKVSEKKKFNKLMDLHWYDIMSGDHKWLNERRIDGPHRLTFSEPIEE